MSGPKSNARGVGRQQSLRGGLITHSGDDFEDGDNSHEVSILMISLRTKVLEIVIARNPNWDRVISVINVKPDDMLIVSLSNGGVVQLSHSMLRNRARDGLEFEIAVQEVPLASSLRMTVENPLVDDTMIDTGPAMGGVAAVTSTSATASSSRSNSRRDTINSPTTIDINNNAGRIRTRTRSGSSQIGTNGGSRLGSIQELFDATISIGKK